MCQIGKKTPIFVIKRNRAKFLSTEQGFLLALPAFFFSHRRLEGNLYTLMDARI